MDITKLRGAGTALVTPFRADGSIDFSALGKLVEYQIAGGIDFLVALGTTSEAATMTNDERHAVVDYIIEVNAGRVPVIVGVGGNNTQEIVDKLNAADKPGIDGILSVVPYYNKPNQQGIYEHFKAVANATNLPIILYNVPSRSSVNMTAETTVKLAKQFKNIVAVKEASGDFDQAMQIIMHKPADFLVLSGDDGITLPLVSIGFDGVISVVTNAYPTEFTKMLHLALEGKFEEARKEHYRFVDIIDTLFAEGNPAGVKAYMKLKGLLEDELRLPLVKVSATLQKEIKMLEKAF